MNLDPNIVVTALGSIGGSVVGALSAWLIFKGKARDDKQALIDQLQEERNASQERADRDRAAYELRIDKMWADKSASRDYVNALKTHIWNGAPPPPPEPPEGYIP